MKSGQRGLNISIVGAGNVGTTLARMLHRAGNRIVAVMSSHKASAAKCGKLVACRNYSDDVSNIPPTTNLVLIAVPDRAIRSVAQSVATLPDLLFNRISVCHTSGAMASDELESLARKGARVFSFHPIQTFPNQKSLSDQIASMRGVTFGIEGSRNALSIARGLARDLGCKTVVIPKEAKIAYHLACVLASNYPVALVGALESVVRLLKQKSTAPYEKLLRTSFENAMKFGAAKALTGPIVRGDNDVIRRHLSIMHDPELLSLYKALGAFALKMAKDEGRLAPEQVAAIENLLEEKE